MRAPPVIDFLVAGVQKGGTTALADYLRGHPQLGVPAAKELHIFDDEQLQWEAPDLSAHLQAFHGLEDRRRWGEATPIYLYWPDSLERIARYRRDMRLILLFRDPVERAWSQWRMETDRGFDDAPAFGWAIREGRERVAASPKGAHRVYSYVERGFYGGQLARLDALFPREQILMLRSEDLAEEPEGTLERVHRFLSVDAHPPQKLLRSNVGGNSGSTMPPADRAYLCDLYAADLAAFARSSGLDVAGWARR